MRGTGMNRTLGLLLVIQLAVVAFIYWPKSSAPVSTSALVTELAGSPIDAIRIISGEGEEVSLSRTLSDGPWILASGLPAAAERVATLLQTLTETDPGFAIARSDGAAQRFEVAPEDFERRIILTSGETEKTVYLGSAPSFRKVHARRDGDNAIYILEFNSYDAPTEENGWLDRKLLALSDVDHISLYGIDYRLTDEGWARGDGEAVNAEAAETLIQALAGLQVSGVVEVGDADAENAGESLRMDVRAGSETLRLTILDNPETERYYLQSDAFDALFDTSAYDAERIIEASRTLAGLEPVDDEPLDEESLDENPMGGEAGVQQAVLDGALDSALEALPSVEPQPSVEAEDTP